MLGIEENRSLKLQCETNPTAQHPNIKASQSLREKSKTKDTRGRDNVYTQHHGGTSPTILRKREQT